MSDRPSLDALLTRVAGTGLAERVAGVAGGLRALGVAPGDAVAWQSPNREEVGICFRACWRLGATAVPVHHQLGSVEVDRVLDAAAPVAVLDDLDALPEGPPVTEFWGDPSARAAILFTSGTTGAPKGVVHSQATLAYKAVQMATVHELGRDDCVLVPAPCAHISGLQNGVTLPGVVPFRSVFMARWDPDVAVDLVEREQVTFMVGPPTFFVAMMRARGFSAERVRSLRLISSGGASVSPAFVAEASAAFGARVRRTYGSTEAPSIVTDGRPIGDVELRVDADGELLVRGPEVSLGYLDPTQTAAAFTTDGWFRTGDLATISDDGVVELTGRRREIVIRGGENVSIPEVEAVLEAHPAVRHAVVVGVPDDLMGERVAAFLVADQPLDVDAVRRWLAEQGVATFKAPERVTLIETVPTLPSGKPDRATLLTQLA